MQEVYTLANPMPNKRVYRERRQTLSVMMQTVGHTLSPGKTFSANPKYLPWFFIVKLYYEGSQDEILGLSNG